MIHEINFILTLISAMKSALKFIISNHYGLKCLSNQLLLEPYNIMFEVISDIIAHWYDMSNTFVIAINFCNAELCHYVIISYHCGIKCLSNFLHFEQAMIC